MSFNSSTYVNFVSAASAAQERLFLQYLGHRSDFDIIIIGSGIGGGVLGDDLAERLGQAETHPGPGSWIVFVSNPRL